MQTAGQPSAFSRQITNSTESMASTDTPSITHCKGRVPVSRVSKPPANWDSAAPPPIMIAPPSPLAVPARCGLTEIEPAMTLGNVMPLPTPRNTQNPKKLSGWITPYAPKIAPIGNFPQRSRWQVRQGQSRSIVAKARKCWSRQRMHRQARQRMRRN